MATEAPNALGTYLRDRRTRLDPAAFGFAGGRRRTPGLRREEVASRANISPTWYTWLEQGRGGAPSADVLDRIAKGLMLTEPEREHLYMLGLGRPPEARYQPVDGITPRLQRVLDGMPLSPAIIKTATWDVVGWNRAATALLTDYSKLPREGAQHPAPDVRQRSRSRPERGLEQCRSLRCRRVPGGRGVRGRDHQRRGQEAGRRTLPHQPRVRSAVAGQ